METLSNLLPHVVNGLSLGLLFALIALGFMLIVGVMEVINLAHGSLFALGAYVALQMLGSSSTPSIAAWLAVLVAAPLAVGASGTLLELCMRRTYGRDPLYGLLLTFGAALVIEEIIRAAWGSIGSILGGMIAFLILAMTLLVPLGLLLWLLVQAWRRLPLSIRGQR